jgi:hypothetical protein
MPFLEVLTRACKRPRMLAVNQASLRNQTDRDLVQTLLVDDVGRGINWATENMAAYAPQLVGDWVWILDDDDTCILPTLVAELKFIVADSDPDLIMVRMDHGAGRILPDDDTWHGPPVLSHIGCSAYVVRRVIWQAHAGAMLPGEYHSDYKFISSIWAAKPSVYWHDVIASRVMKQSFGAPETTSPWQLQRNS